VEPAGVWCYHRMALSFVGGKGPERGNAHPQRPPGPQAGRPPFSTVHPPTDQFCMDRSGPSPWWRTDPLLLAGVAEEGAGMPKKRSRPAGHETSNSGRIWITLAQNPHKRSAKKRSARKSAAPAGEARLQLRDPQSAAVDLTTGGRGTTAIHFPESGDGRPAAVGGCLPSSSAAGADCRSLSQSFPLRADAAKSTFERMAESLTGPRAKVATRLADHAQPPHPVAFLKKSRRSRGGMNR